MVFLTPTFYLQGQMKSSVRVTSLNFKFHKHFTIKYNLYVAAVLPEIEANVPVNTPVTALANCLRNLFLGLYMSH